MASPLRLQLLLLIVLLAPSSAARGTLDTAKVRVEISVVPKLEAFYSPARGIGAGATATLRNLGWAGSELVISSATMTRHGEYSAFLFTADPREAPLFGGFGAFYTGTRAYRFYGLGPRSHRDDAIAFTARRVEAEARAGWAPFVDLPLVVQPRLRLLHANLRSFEEDDPGAFERLRGVDRASILRAVESPSTGLSVGLSLILDFLDEPAHPRRGVLLQATGSRYAGLDDDPFGFWQGQGIVHGALPIVGPRGILEGRLAVVVTRSAGSDSRPIPFFALPTLDSELVGGYPRYRLVGNDLFAASAGFRFPVLDVLNWIGAEGFVAVHAANVYDDLFQQFEPRVSFAQHLARTGDRAPLRPALTLGGHIVNLGSGLPIVSGQIGFSPEGFELAGLDFLIDLRGRRPAIR